MNKIKYNCGACGNIHYDKDYDSEVDTLIEKEEPKTITVKQLILLLLDEDMNSFVEARDETGKHLKRTKLVLVKPEGLVSLFG